MFEASRRDKQFRWLKVLSVARLSSAWRLLAFSCQVSLVNACDVLQAACDELLAARSWDDVDAKSLAASDF